MLKFFRSIEWKPILPYLALIVIVTGFAQLTPYFGQPIQQVSDAASAQAASDNHSYVAEYLEALATCVIAVFAFLQIRDSRISNERQLRAYVFPMGAKTVPHGRPGIEFTLEVIIDVENTGQTPARRVKESCGFRFGKEDLRRPFNEEENFPQEAILAPAGKHKITIRLKAANVPEGQHGVYIVGRIEYLDVFDTPQWTTFRFELRLDAITNDWGIHPSSEGSDAS